MPLQKLQLRPGINREGTTLANEGGWFECNKVRFRSGFPEKIGGWVKDAGTQSGGLAPPSGSFWGIARSMWNWLTLTGANLLGIGTSDKYYIQNGPGGYFYDITPIRSTVTTGANAFTTTNGSTTVVANVAANGANVGDFVTVSGVGGAINGIPAAELNAEFKITAASAGTISFVVTTAATSSGTTGSATFAMQIHGGNTIATPLTGWGAGGWGTGKWGMSTASVAVDNEIRLWSDHNYGQNLIINPRYGPLYMWVPSGSSTFNRAVLLSSTSSGVYQTDADCPSTCHTFTVSDASRFVLAFGVNDYGSSVADPLLVRWSDQEDYRVWTPDITNQAGSYRLSSGSELKSVLQTRQEVLVWTDAALYSMQYIGPPDVWGFTIMADMISIAGPNVTVIAAGAAYWMGVDKFYVYTGSVAPLPCTLRQYIFGDINIDQGYQFFAGTNEGFNEIWWFYCSANSTTVDRYVIYNYLEKVWSYGTMARTAWLDSPLRPGPLGAGYDGQLLVHEQGVDDGSTNPPSAIESYVQSSDFDIGDGHNYGFVWRVIPDVTFDGSNSAAPEVNLTVRPRQNPGSQYGAGASPAVVSGNNYTGQRNYTVQQFTEIVYVRIRGRQMAFKISSSTVGTQWQLGVPNIDVRPDGRR